ncbi:MAG: ABC transporter substrate-binding protein [Desulfococcaceae bacterium]
MKWFRGIGLLALLLLPWPVGPGPAMAREKETAGIDAPKTPIRVQLNGRHRFRYAGFYAADSKGFYQAAGLDVKLLAGGPEIDPVDEVVAGHAEYGVAGTDLLPRRLQGEPVRALAAIFQHSPEVLIVRADRGINGPRDLIGRRVMTDPDKNVAAEAMLRSAGVSPSDIQRVPHSGDFADMADLIEGRVDAISGDKTYAPYHMEQLGVLSATLQPSSREIDFYGDILFASRAEWTDHPRRVREFRRATLRGWVYAMNHPEEIIELIRLRHGHELGLQYLRFESLVMRQLILPDIVEMGHMSATRWRHIADVYRELGMIPENVSFDPADFLFDSDPPPDYAWVPWALAISGGAAFLAGLWALTLLVFNNRLNALVQTRTSELEATNRRLAAEVEERLGAEDALRRTQERYELVIHGSDEGIWDWDMTTDSVYFSPRWKEMLGYADAELPNRIREWRSRVHPEDYPAVLNAHQRYWEGKTDSFKATYRLRARDGEYRWILGRATCVWDENGRPLRMTGSHSDITERKRAETELAALRRLLRNIIDALPSAIIAVDGQGRVTHWSAEAARRGGLPAEAAIGRTFSSVMPLLNSRREAIAAAIRDRKQFQEPRLPVPGVDEIRYLDIMVSPLSPTEDAGAVIRVDDTTERVRMDETMIQSEKMLSVGGLAAGMAHEINNPLGTIVTNAGLVWSRLAGELPVNRGAAEECGLDWEALGRYLERRKVRDRLDGILEAGRRAGEIVENMLRFSRKSEVFRTALSLPLLVERTIALARNDGKIKRALKSGSVEIVRDFDPELPRVPGVATEIQQVLFNLLTNAFYSLENRDPAPNPGRIELRLRQRESWAVIEVIDNGPGMAEAVRRRVFEPFFTTKGPGEGTGLGLSVSYFIVTENHGGKMEAHSVPGRGATFSIELPLTGQADALEAVSRVSRAG